MSLNNLLDRFVLKHLQISQLDAELRKVAQGTGAHEAKVELNLTPKLMNADAGQELPSYQVTATLRCKGGGEEQKGPSFKASVSFEAVYQQVDGEPMDLSEFTANHASLTRQLYPLLQSELRNLLSRLGINQIQLPFDLAPRVEESKEKKVEVSQVVH